MYLSLIVQERKADESWKLGPEMLSSKILLQGGMNYALSNMH